MSVTTGHFFTFSSRGKPCGVEVMEPPKPSKLVEMSRESNGDGDGDGTGAGSAVLRASNGDEKILSGAGAGAVKAPKTLAAGAAGADGAEKRLSIAGSACVCVRACVYDSRRVLTLKE